MHVQSMLIQLISGVNRWPVGSLTFLFRERALCAILIHFCGCRKEACSSRYRGPLRRIFPSFLPCDAIMQAWALNAPLPFILSRMKLHPNPTQPPTPTLAWIYLWRFPFFPPLSTDDRAEASGKSTGCESMQVGQHALIKADDCLSAAACSRTVMLCCLFSFLFFCSAVRDQLKGLAFFSSFWGRALLELTQVF